MTTDQQAAFDSVTAATVLMVTAADFVALMKFMCWQAGIDEKVSDPMIRESLAELALLRHEGEKVPSAES